MEAEKKQGNYGTVISVRSSVVDARFTKKLPGLLSVLRGGEGGEIVIEVLIHLDERTVRGIALTSTQGLAEGSALLDTGNPLKVPVGDRLLG